MLAADDWHPGVIGIVAARIAERHHRPAVLIALDGPEGTGSGRSIPAFDLLGGLTAASWHLDRYGGHRAAAGLTIARDRIDGFRERFAAHAAEVLTPDDLVPQCRIDAVVAGDALTLGLAEELERMAPFGQGNPAVSLMVPAAELADPRPLGEGRHVAFTLHAGGARSRCVQFGKGNRLPAAPGEPVDVAVRLEANRWNGAVEPRLVLRHARPAGSPDRRARRARLRRRPRARARPRPHGRAGRPRRSRPARPRCPPLRHRRPARRPRRLRRAGARRRRPRAPPRARPARPRRRLCRLLVGGARGRPGARRAVRHLVAVDPPSSARLLGLLERPSGGPKAHLAWGEPELRFAQRIHEWDFALREPLTTLYRALRGAGTVRGEALEAVLRGEGPQPRSAALAGRLVRVLTELDLVVLDREGPALRIAEAPARTALERSPAFRAYHQRLEDGLTYLTSETTRRQAA